MVGGWVYLMWVCTVYDECRCVYWERVGVYVECGCVHLSPGVYVECVCVCVGV